MDAVAAGQPGSTGTGVGGAAAQAQAEESAGAWTSDAADVGSACATLV